jgi:VanZ family protein
VNPSHPDRRALWFWLSYALFILYVTSLPFDFVFSTSRALERLRAVPLHLFMSPDGGRASFSDMVQNVVLFAPFGALTVATLSRRRLAVAVCGGAVAGFALSVTVETLQLFTVDRVTSLNDVATDTTGAVLGALVAASAIVVARRIGTEAAQSRVAHELYPVLAWSAVLVLATWHPFDTTIDVSGIAGKVRSVMRDPWQAGAIGDEGVDAIRYALFSAALVVCLTRLGWRRPRLLGALAGSFMAFAMEFSQFFVSSRMPGMKDVTVGVVGSCLAAWLSVPHLWSRRLAAGVVVVASVLATALVTLNPFEVQATHRPFQLFPFRAYQAVSPEAAISHAVELSLAFFPIGFAMGLVLSPRQRWLRVMMMALALGGVLEYLQGWIVGRYPDVTDVATLALGALGGAWAAIHSYPEGETEPSVRST